MANVFIAVFAILSVILFTVAITSFIGDRKKRREYAECIGTIERIGTRRMTGKNKRRKVVFPIITYTVYGRTYEMNGTSYSNEIPVGETVVILYDENDPSKAMMQKGMYFTSFVTGIVGTAFAAVSLIMAVLKYAGLLSF